MYIILIIFKFIVIIIVRLKRKNQTMFLHVEPSHSFLQIKQRIGEYFKMDASSIMFYASDKVSFL